MYENEIKLVIIGSGVSGLAMAKAAIEKNIPYIILERNETYGGCWSSTFQNTRLQSHIKNYQFRDFPIKTKNKYPFRDEILEYLNEYQTKFNINKINYNCEVINISKIGNKWNIKYKNKRLCSTETLITSYVAICTGYYNKYREIKGLSKFKGKILNFRKENKESLEICKKSERILIVGNGASCVDLLKYWDKLGEINDINFDICYKKNKYFINEKYANIVSFFVNPYFLYLIKILPYWIVLMSILFFCKFNGHYPNEKFKYDNVVGSSIITKLETIKNLDYIKSDISMCINNYVVFCNGRIKKYDTIINKAGFSRSIKFFDECIEDIDEILGYNYCCADNYPNCAFIGFSPSINWLPVSEAQSLWFSRIITGEIQFPSKMENGNFKKQNKKTDGRTFNDLTYESLDFSKKIFCNK